MSAPTITLASVMGTNGRVSVSTYGDQLRVYGDWAPNGGHQAHSGLDVAISARAMGVPGAEALHLAIAAWTHPARGHLTAPPAGWSANMLVERRIGAQRL